MEFDLEYNSERTHLIIPEYGRHIQKLIDHCIALPEKEERDKMAKAIIEVMGNLQPHLRDIPDFSHKLWDQLTIMSDFKLDVESPYPKFSRENFAERPDALAYPKSASKYRFYGNNIQIMVDTALTWDESDQKEALVYAIANHMKKCYLNWNKDTVEDAVIFKHLKEISLGKIDITNSDAVLSHSSKLLRKRITNKHHSKNPKNTRYKKR